MNFDWHTLPLKNVQLDVHIGIILLLFVSPTFEPSYLAIPFTDSRGVGWRRRRSTLSLECPQIVQTAVTSIINFSKIGSGS